GGTFKNAADISEELLGRNNCQKKKKNGLEPKGLSPPHKKSKAKKPECSKDSSEGESEKLISTVLNLSQCFSFCCIDGVNAATGPSPASEEAVEVCKDEDSAKDKNITKDNEVTDHSECGQDHPNGQEHDSTKNEIKLEADSQSSYMETEELLPNQEDATTVEQPEVIPLTDDQEDKEGEKGSTINLSVLISFCHPSYGTLSTNTGLQ
uniref:Uncharacterized protein n=1 Tax=Canis lupus dingo TaxID=286419 RepID=A0A8C0LV21_CANLU